MALFAGDRMPVLARLGEDGRMGPARTSDLLCGFGQVRQLRGRVAARRTGEPMGSEGAGGEAGICLRDGWIDRSAEVARADRRFSYRLRTIQRYLARRIFSKRLRLVVGGTDRTTAARSEERRVGKECRSRGWVCVEQKNVSLRDGDQLR